MHVKYIKQMNNEYHKVSAYGKGAPFFLCKNIPGPFPCGFPIIIEGNQDDQGAFICSSVAIDYSEEYFPLYLAGRKFKGIGTAKAKRIYSDYIDQKSIREIAKNTSVLPESVDAFIRYVECIKYAERLNRQFPSIILSNAIKICKKTNNDCIADINSDPYGFGSDIGFDFYQCDKIAFSLGYEYDDPERMKCLVRLLSNRISQSGNTYTDIDTAVKQCIYLLKKGSFKEIPCIDYLKVIIMTEPYLVPKFEDGKFKLCVTYLLKKEERITSNIKRIQKGSKPLNITPVIPQYCDPDQQDAITGCVKDTGIKIITGGPGTGKTTVIKSIVKSFETRNLSYALCAPTGRAAARIEENTGYKASTMHKLLNIKLRGENAHVSEYNATNKLPYKAIIIDESSMVGTDIFDQFLEALPDDIALIMVGDANQLESVEPGNILGDLITSETIPVHNLTFIHRQKDGNIIIGNERKVLEGKTNLSVGFDFSIYRFDTAEDLTKQMFEIIDSDYWPNDPYHLQILSPIKGGSLGKDNLNKIISTHIHHPDANEIETRYRVGDKVMTIRNNYGNSLTYMNGDIGLVSCIDEETIWVKINGKEVPVDDTEDLDLAYVSTVHKAQGSEYDHVLIILSEDASCMLYNNLLYTAITRAKERVMILYMGDALYRSISTRKNGIRKTRLVKMLKG